MAIIQISRKGDGYRVTLRGVYIYQTTTREVAKKIEHRLFSGFTNQEWRDKALCKYYPASWFHSSNKEDREKALDVCKSCPVKYECLGYAIITREEYGIWGGKLFSYRIYRNRKAGNVTLSSEGQEVYNPVMGSPRIIVSHKAIAANFERARDGRFGSNQRGEIRTP